MAVIWLSHFLSPSTPTYRNRDRVEILSVSSIERGDPTSNSRIHLPVHAGTHVDLPRHFHAGGQTLESYPPSFWIFEEPRVLQVEARGPVLKDEILDALGEGVRPRVDLLLVKTGMGAHRGEPRYWNGNPGFHPDLALTLRERLPGLRALGFDGISLTGHENRELGRDAHRRFLDPAAPILLIEDMDLREIGPGSPLTRVIVSPLLLAGTDGAPCTAIGFLEDPLR